MRESCKITWKSKRNMKWELGFVSRGIFGSFLKSMRGYQSGGPHKSGYSYIGVYIGVHIGVPILWKLLIESKLAGREPQIPNPVVIFAEPS